MSHVVVAGGAGFLGSHMCERLIARGDSVVCLDDLSTGSHATTWRTCWATSGSASS